MSQQQNTPPQLPAPPPLSHRPSPARCLSDGRPNCVASPRARITTCSHHHVVTPFQCMSAWFTPSGAGWLLMSISGRSMCSPLLIISKGAPLPRGAAVDSRLMALPPPPSPNSPAFAVQCIHPPPVSRRSMREGEELEADLSKGPQLHSEGVRLLRSPEKKVPLSSGRCVGVISCPCSSLASHLYVSTSSGGVTLVADNFIKVSTRHPFLVSSTSSADAYHFLIRRVPESPSHWLDRGGG